MSALKEIVVARDFSMEPSGRYPNDGPYNGQSFREEYVLPALSGGGIVRVILDGTNGYGSSFLNEAFTKIFENGSLPIEDYGTRLQLVANEQAYEVYKSFVDRQVAQLAEKV